MLKPPLERAARALCELDNNPSDAMMEGRPLWMDYLPEVRAGLEAIREPSEGMRGAGMEITLHVDPDESDDAYRDDAADVWRTMIDAALEGVS